MEKHMNLFASVARSHMYWGRKPLTGLYQVFQELRIGRGQVLVDPFCGAGTPALAALTLGASAVLGDLNPMATFLTRVCLQPLSLAAIDEAAMRVGDLVGQTTMDRYRANCYSCGADAYIDFVVWAGNNPTAAAVVCPKCGCIRRELSHRQRAEQVRKSSSQPRNWFPQTEIRARRKVSVRRHCELFTPRNLAALSDIWYAIKLCREKACREAMQYVFTAMLYSCSRMQMYSGKDPRSSRGWTAPRYYLPPACKEKNVWTTFQSRLERFKRLKRELNELLPSVCITDSRGDFLAPRKDAMICLGDAFSFLEEFGSHGDCIFLDPPFNDDIEYMSFSQFWGSWFEMDFAFESEWHPRIHRSEWLRKLLVTAHKHSKPSCTVVLSLSPKTHSGWNQEECIAGSGYHVRSGGSFLYDHSHRRGQDKLHADSYFILSKQGWAIRDGATSSDVKIKQVADPARYLQFWQHVTGENSPEKVRSGAAELAPAATRHQLSQWPLNRVSEAIRDADANRRAYRRLCCDLTRSILERDGWQIDYIGHHQVEGKSDRGTPAVGNQLPDPAKDSCFAAAKGDRRIVFYFDDQGAQTLCQAATRIAEADAGAFKTICVMIVKKLEDMPRLRHVRGESDDGWPRGFYVSFDELRARCREVASDTYAQLFGPERPLFALPKPQSIGEFDAEVVANTLIGGTAANHLRLRFHAPELRRILPGQFVMMDAAPARRQPDSKPVSRREVRGSLELRPVSFLKRPFSIHRAFYPHFRGDYLKRLSLPPTIATVLHTAMPNTFDIFYKVLPKGVGTNEMRRLRSGDSIRMLGPLGQGINVRDLRAIDVQEVHVIGGGVGMAPLVYLVQALRYYSFQVKAFIGVESLEMLKDTSPRDDLDRTYAETARDAFIYVNDLLATGLSPKDIFVSSDRGDTKIDWIPHENCHHGLVSTQYQNELRSKRFAAAMAFACGPMPMMRAISEICRERDIPLKVFMEKRMACGIGVCLSCVCKIRNVSDHYARVCTEGPIFDASEIVWE